MNNLKNSLLTFFASVLAVANAHAQCGSVVTRTWDGGGSDDFFFTPENWSGDVVPDCNDNIVFNTAVMGRAGNKGCRITGSFITSGNITINSSYTGKISVSGAGTVIEANNFTMNGGLLITTADVGRWEFQNIIIGEQCMFAFRGSDGLSVNNAVTVQSAGYMSLGANSTVNLHHINVNPYSQFIAPEYGTVNITGNIRKGKISTFHHKFSTWNIIGDAGQTVISSDGGSGSNATSGNLSLWNVNLNKTTNTSASTDNWSISDPTDTVTVLNRLTVIAGDLVGNSSQSGFQFHDTLELLGEGREGHTGRLFCGGNKTADIILNDNLAKGTTGITLVVQKESNGSILNFHKGSGNQISMPAASINAERGTIEFPDDVTVNIPNRLFTIGSDATLTMPAAATVKMDATTMTITGTVIANTATLEFVGTNVITTNFGGGARKAFYNILVNTANTSAGVRVASTDTLEALNNVTLETGMLSRAAPTSIGVVYINGDFEVKSSASASTYGDGLQFVIGGSNNTQYIGDALLPSGMITIDKASSANIVTATATGNKIFVGTNAAANGLHVKKGKLSFDDKNSLISTSTGTPAFIVDADGVVEAPATDTLNFRGSWNFAHRNGLNAKNGTIAIGSGTNNYNQNGNAITVNNLLIDKTGTQSWLSTDTLIVKGEFRMVAGATFNNAHLVFEGNFTKTLGTVALSSVIAAGSNDQTINLNAQDDIRNEGLKLNKSAGTVFIGSTIRLDSLRMSGGKLNSNGQSMIVYGANSISGGSSSSFIEGTIRISSSTVWSNNRYFIPVGRGSNYRPVQLHAAHATNDWTITYVASDTVTDLGTAGTHGIDTFSTSEHWIINRVNAGGSGNNAFVELSTLGKSPYWNDADIRIGRWNPTIPAWVDHTPGTTGASSNSIITTLAWTEQNTRIFTIGVNNVPAPIAVRHDGISGNELDLAKNTMQGNSQIVTKPAISFNVFPNPVAETLNIALSGADKGSITLSDLSGKVLGVYNANTRSINMNQFAAGVYFATFSNGSQRITQRFIRN